MEKTVLILGAGFSIPYGYPSGRKLVKDIIKKHINSSSPDARAMAESLRDAAPASIDRYLTARPDHLAMGKSAIVDEILEAEVKSLRVEVDISEDIFDLLLNRLQTDDLDQIKIITFNYDRYLEWRFFQKFRTYFQDEKKALQELAKIGIEHIHGRMIPFSALEANLVTPGSEEYCPYDPDASYAGLRNNQIYLSKVHAHKNFHTIYTNTDGVNTRAVGFIKSAKRVFFLGFSFDEKNMLKLGIGDQNIIFDWDGKYVAGTCKGMPPVDKKTVELKFPFLKSRLFDVNSREFFDYRFSLTDPESDVELSEVKTRTCCETFAIQNRPGRPDEKALLSYRARITCTQCSSESVVSFKRKDSNDPFSAVFNRGY